MINDGVHNETVIDDNGVIEEAEQKLTRVFSPRGAKNVFFAAPADDPRVRRKIDAAVLVTSLLAGVLMGWMYQAQNTLDTKVFTLFANGIPNWLTGLATLVFMFGGLYTLGLVIGIATLAPGRLPLARDILMAILVALSLALVCSYAFGPEFPDMFPEFTLDGIPSFPAVRLMTAVAAIRVATPYLAVPMRTIGRRMLWALALATLVLNFGTVSSVIGATMFGIAAAAIIHLLFGSGLGIPSRERIIGALSEAGIEVADIEYLDEGPGGVFLVRATRTDGDQLVVKLYGRDASDNARAARLWRSTWYRDGNSNLAVNGQQLAEHDALVSLALERAGVPALRLVGWGGSASGDTLVVSEWPDGIRMAAYEPDALDDAKLDRIWALLDQLHTTPITHGAIDADRVIIGESSVIFHHFDQASILAGEPGRQTDRMQLLVSIATVVGSERAIDSARRGLGDEKVAELLPVMQTPALPRPLHRQIKVAALKLKRLRADTAAALEIPVPDAAEIRRVSWAAVLMMAMSLLAAYVIITGLLDVGVDTIIDTLSEASPAWFLVALCLAQMTNLCEYLSLRGVVGFPIPFGPTIMFRYAMSFVSLAVPSDAGTIAMNVRYMTKLGVPTTAALAQGPLLTVVSKSYDVILLLITASFLGQSIDTDDVDLGPMIRIVIFVCVAAILAVVVVLAVPKLRNKVMPHVKEGFHAIKGAVTEPDRLWRLLTGTFFMKMLFALTLMASTMSVGGSITFVEALFVNSAVSLLIGFIPVPGGIGVGEAALSAGLIAVGVPESTAVAAAMVHRLVTAYIPPMFGWWTSRWLIARDYL